MKCAGFSHILQIFGHLLDAGRDPTRAAVVSDDYVIPHEKVLGSFDKKTQAYPGEQTHWPNALSFVMAGGGMPMGQVIGATTARGEEPRERRLRPGDVLATWYRFLGIDHHRVFPDAAGRPVPLVPQGEPIRELCG